MSKEYRYSDLDPFLTLLAETSTEHEKKNVELADYLSDLCESEAFEEIDQTTLEAMNFMLGYLTKRVENRQMRQAGRRIY